MADDAMMRFLLQRVLAYRELCRMVRSSGRGNVFFALLFFAFAYWSLQQVPANGGFPIIVAIYAALATAEIGVGLFKWFFASAEGILLDALLLFVFALLNLGSQALLMLAGQNPNGISVFFGVILFASGVRRVQNYLELRRAFADRPTAEQIRWFDDLIYEIKRSDPATDDLALDLPTRPHWKAKLLGTTAFFVEKSGREVIVLGPWDFALVPEGNLTRLIIADRTYKPFELDDASSENYRKWVASHT
jgi:hypothetical protein